MENPQQLIKNKNDKYSTPVKKVKKLFDTSFSKTFKDSTDRILDLIKQKFFEIIKQHQFESKYYQELAQNISIKLHQAPVDEYSNIQHLLDMICHLNKQMKMQEQTQKKLVKHSSEPIIQTVSQHNNKSTKKILTKCPSNNNITLQNEQKKIAKNNLKINLFDQQLLKKYGISWTNDGLIQFQPNIIDQFQKITKEFLNINSECKNIVQQAFQMYSYMPQISNIVQSGYQKEQVIVNNIQLENMQKDINTYNQEIQSYYSMLIQQFEERINQLKKEIIRRDKILGTYSKNIKQNDLSPNSQQIVQNLQEKINEESLSYSLFESTPDSNIAHQITFPKDKQKNSDSQSKQQLKQTSTIYLNLEKETQQCYADNHSSSNKEDFSTTQIQEIVEDQDNLSEDQLNGIHTHIDELNQRIKCLMIQFDPKQKVHNNKTVNTYNKPPTASYNINQKKVERPSLEIEVDAMNESYNTQQTLTSKNTQIKQQFSLLDTYDNKKNCSSIVISDTLGDDMNSNMNFRECNDSIYKLDDGSYIFQIEQLERLIKDKVLILKQTLDYIKSLNPGFEDPETNLFIQKFLDSYINTNDVSQKYSFPILTQLITPENKIKFSPDRSRTKNNNYSVTSSSKDQVESQNTQEQTITQLPISFTNKNRVFIFPETQGSIKEDSNENDGSKKNSERINALNQMESNPAIKASQINKHSRKFENLAITHSIEFIDQYELESQNENIAKQVLLKQKIKENEELKNQILLEVHSAQQKFDIVYSKLQNLKDQEKITVMFTTPQKESEENLLDFNEEFQGNIENFISLSIQDQFNKQKQKLELLLAEIEYAITSKEQILNDINTLQIDMETVQNIKEKFQQQNLELKDQLNNQIQISQQRMNFKDSIALQSEKQLEELLPKQSKLKKIINDIYAKYSIKINNQNKNQNITQSAQLNEILKYFDELKINSPNLFIVPQQYNDNLHVVEQEEVKANQSPTLFQVLRDNIKLSPSQSIIVKDAQGFEPQAIENSNDIQQINLQAIDLQRMKNNLSNKFDKIKQKLHKKIVFQNTQLKNLYDLIITQCKLIDENFHTNQNLQEYPSIKNFNQNANQQFDIVELIKMLLQKYQLKLQYQSKIIKQQQCTLVSTNIICNQAKQELFNMRNVIQSLYGSIILKNQIENSIQKFIERKINSKVNSVLLQQFEQIKKLKQDLNSFKLNINDKLCQFKELVEDQFLSEINNYYYSKNIKYQNTLQKKMEDIKLLKNQFLLTKVWIINFFEEQSRQQNQYLYQILNKFQKYNNNHYSSKIRIFYEQCQGLKEKIINIKEYINISTNSIKYQMNDSLVCYCQNINKLRVQEKILTQNKLSVQNYLTQQLRNDLDFIKFTVQFNQTLQQGFTQNFINYFIQTNDKKQCSKNQVLKEQLKIVSKAKEDIAFLKNDCLANKIGQQQLELKLDQLIRDYVLTRIHKTKREYQSCYIQKMNELMAQIKFVKQDNLQIKHILDLQKINSIESFQQILTRFMEFYLKKLQISKNLKKQKLKNIQSKLQLIKYQNYQIQKKSQHFQKSFKSYIKQTQDLLNIQNNSLQNKQKAILNLKEQQISNLQNQIQKLYEQMKSQQQYYESTIFQKDTQLQNLNSKLLSQNEDFLKVQQYQSQIYQDQVSKYHEEIQLAKTQFFELKESHRIQKSNMMKKITQCERVLSVQQQKYQQLYLFKKSVQLFHQELSSIKNQQTNIFTEISIWCKNTFQQRLKKQLSINQNHLMKLNLKVKQEIADAQISLKQMISQYNKIFMSDVLILSDFYSNQYIRLMDRYQQIRHNVKIYAVQFTDSYTFFIQQTKSIKQDIQQLIEENENKIQVFLYYFNKLQNIIIQYQTNNISTKKMQTKFQTELGFQQYNDLNEQHKSKLARICQLLYKTLKFLMARETIYYNKSIKPAISTLMQNSTFAENIGTQMKAFESGLKMQEVQIKQLKERIQSQEELIPQISLMLNHQKSNFDLLNNLVKQFE